MKTKLIAMLMVAGIARSEMTSQLSDGRQSMKNVLVTGAGTGIGNEVAMRLAQRGYTVIAGVEIPAEVEAVKRQAIRRGVSLRVEKLDVTNEAASEKIESAKTKKREVEQKAEAIIGERATS